MKIAVLGLGGVGATVAGALKKVENDLILIARGKTKEAIIKDGLNLQSDLLGNINVKPGLVSDNPDEIGIVDILFISCKGYSLKYACEKYRDIVGEDTIVIPLLNGISARDNADSYLENRGIVAAGYIYCFSSILSPGNIKNTGSMLRMGFTFDGKDSNKKALYIEELLEEGGIAIPKGNDALKELWKKYIMMCGNSATFIYFNCKAGEVQEDPEKMKVLDSIYDELRSIGVACGIDLEREIVDGYMEEFKFLPKDTVSSLYRDILQGSANTELESVLGDGIRLAEKLGVEIPYTKAAYEKQLMK